MKTARYPVDQNGQLTLDLTQASAWVRVTARTYDPDLHGANLRCWCPSCTAPVHFVPSKTVQTGSSKHASHFKSGKVSSHTAECPAIEQTYDMGRNTNHLTLAQARNADLPMIFTLNAAFGNQSFGPIGRPTYVDALDTPYNRFRAHNPDHASISIKNTENFMSMIRRVYNQAPKALKNIYIAHCQDMRPISKFAIGENPGKLRTLFRTLANGDKSFTRLFKFSLPEKGGLIFSPAGNYALNCNDVTLGRLQGTSVALTLRNRLEFSSAELYRKAREYGTGYVIAAPSVESERLHNEALGKFRMGEPASVTLVWTITDEGQMRPANGPAAEALEFAANAAVPAGESSAIVVERPSPKILAQVQRKERLKTPPGQLSLNF